MKEHSASWKKGAFFVCEKCGRRENAPVELQGFAEELKTAFKKQLRESGQGAEIRPMVSGCLSLCPPGKQAAAWCPQGGDVELIEFDKNEKDQVFSWLLGR